MAETTGQVQRRVALTATAKRMTVRELQMFMLELERSGISDEAPVKGQVSMSGHLRKIEV